MMKTILVGCVLFITVGFAGSGPVGLWHFDEAADSTIARDSAQNHPGTLVGPVGFVEDGISGKAVRIQLGGYIDMGDVLHFGDEDFSLAAWVKLPEGNAREQILLAKHQAGYGGYLVGMNYHLSTYGKDGRAWFYTIGAPGYQPTSTTVISDGQWHFVVSVYHKGGIGEIFVDGGSAEDTKTMPLNPMTNAPFRIGAISAGAGCDAWVDEVQVYDHALTKAEVQGLYDKPGSVVGGNGGINTGMTLWLKADDCASVGDGNPVATWPDASGKGLDVSIPSGQESRRPVYVADAIHSRPAIRFDGDDYLVRPDTAGWELTSTEEATVFVVLKQSGSDSRNTILGWADGGNRFMLHTTWEDILALQHGYIYSAQGNWTQPTGWDDQYHVVEFVRDNPSFECIIDGTALAQQSGNTILNLAQRNMLYIGNDAWDNIFTGDLCEMMVYDRALTISRREEVRRYLADRYGITARKQVNLETFAGLASHWLETGCSAPDWCGQADRNISGEVNLLDLLDLVAVWLQ